MRALTCQAPGEGIPRAQGVKNPRYGNGLAPGDEAFVARLQVLLVPPGSRVLASSECCPVEMFALGDSVLGIQGRDAPFVVM